LEAIHTLAINRRIESKILTDYNLTKSQLDYILCAYHIAATNNNVFEVMQIRRHYGVLYTNLFYQMNTELINKNLIQLVSKTHAYSYCLTGSCMAMLRKYNKLLSNN
jgi:hypothetical protein